MKKMGEKRGEGGKGLLLREDVHELTYGEIAFVVLARHPATHLSLLVRLQELGLLSEFLAAENGTT